MSFVIAAFKSATSFSSSLTRSASLKAPLHGASFQTCPNSVSPEIRRNAKLGHHPSIDDQMRHQNNINKSTALARKPLGWSGPEPRSVAVASERLTTGVVVVVN